MNDPQGKVYMLPGPVNERLNGGGTWLIKMIGDQKEIGWVYALLDGGAEIDAVDNNGISALMLAASLGNTEVTSLLLERGADVNIDKYVKGWTPLRNASAAGHVEVVRILLENGADQDIAGIDGLTPIELAISNGHLKVIDLLLRRKPVAEQARIGNELAVSLMDDGLLTEALDRFKELLNLPEADLHPLAYQNTAVCLTKLNQYGEAVNILEKALEIWPDETRLRSNFTAIKSDWERIQEEERKAAEETSRKQEEERRSTLQSERKERKECELCGKRLGLIDKIFGKSIHSSCIEFMES